MKRSHYCRICGRYRANEKISGRGHTTHICKDCAKLSPERRDEAETLNRIDELPFWLSKEKYAKQCLQQACHRHMLNNVFNKRAIGGLVFNRYLGDQSIIVRKSVLERLMPGEKPLPPNFKDAP